MFNPLRALFIFLCVVVCVRAKEGDVDVKPMAPGVWLHTSWRTVATWGLVPSNGLIVREGDQVVVVDTAWGDAPSRALLDWIDRELHLPVAKLIVTHFHSDSMGGWEAFAERGARIVVSEQTLALAKLKPMPAFDSFRLAPGEKLACGSLEIYYPGPAHAPDNLVVWLPSARILDGGCAVRAAASGGLGNLSDASISEWGASLARVLAAYPDIRTVLPGHGDVGDAQLLSHTIALTQAAQAKSSAAAP